MKGRPTKDGGTYVIEGTPTRTGVFSFTLTAIDAGGASITRRFKIRVRSPRSESECSRPHRRVNRMAAPVSTPARITGGADQIGPSDPASPRQKRTTPSTTVMA